MWQETEPANQRNPDPSSWAREIVWGWDTTPGIVGLWVERDGRVIRWRRQPDADALVREHARFRPWAAVPTLDGLYATDAPLIFQQGFSPDGDTPEEGEKKQANSQALWVKNLTGAGRLRYLVSADHADTLERLLRRALSHTLGRTVERLGAVDPDELLWLPLEEQYLTVSGQVYFHDLRWDAVHRLTFDLETEGLDPARHRIFLIALRDNRGLRCTIDVAEGQTARGLSPDAAEADLLRRFVALVRQRDPDVLENHNLAGFDLPFLMTRAAHLGVSLALQRPGLPSPYFRRAAPRRAWGAWGSWQSGSAEEGEGGDEPKKHDETRRGRVIVPGRELIDTLDAVWRFDFSARSLPGHGLKAVARALGVAGPTREYIEGADVGRVWRTDPDRVRRYALDDVDEAAAIGALLGGPAFVLAQMAPRRYERVAEAGPATGLLDPLIVRAYLHAGAALPAYRPERTRRQASAEAREDDGRTPASSRLSANEEAETDEDEVVAPHSGGATYLFAAGVARQVVKCDIASLYPSLIRHHRIAPRRDTLGVFLTLVDQLVEQRLAAKRAGQLGDTDAAERKTQGGVAAGLKIVINAAYGYLAAPGLCRLADVAAANAVTAHGRATLDHLCRELAARGVTLLEADTDGVYFAAPEGWTEEDERRCVAEVGQTLPPLVRLEYEARYAAMLSHEVKNYATLGYDGQLTLRGVAFHSRRMEPYGEAFLRQAGACLLAGDIPGVRAVYLDTISRLRRRLISTQDVCVSARLTKTPEKYQRERGKRREAAYEAMLASGRNTWHYGERIRYYCVGPGRFSLFWNGWDAEEATDNQHTLHAPSDAPGGMALPSYDANYYCAQLQSLYAQRLAGAFAPDDFAVLFANPEQPLLFAPPLETIQPHLTRLALLDRLLGSTAQPSV